jgi:3-oxoacyl-[acyl-carrier-protein] synthase III
VYGGFKVGFFIKNIAFEVGKLFDIDKLTEEGIDEKKILLFKKFGLQTYGKSKANIYELAEKSALKTIGEFENKKIKKLLFNTSSFHYPFSRVGSQQEINELLNNLNIDAYPYGVYLSECTNLMSALSIGMAFINKDKEDILIISSDVVGEGESRIVPPGFAIKSDSAASCILSKNKENSCFEIIDIYQSHNKQMAKKNKVLSSEEYAKEFSWCVNSIKENFIKNYNYDYSIVVTNNFNLVFPKSLSFLLKINAEKIYTKAVSKYSHCFSSDILINLSIIMDNENNLKNKKILVVSSSPSSMSSMILKGLR